MLLARTTPISSSWTNRDGTITLPIAGLSHPKASLESDETSTVATSVIKYEHKRQSPHPPIRSCIPGRRWHYNLLNPCTLECVVNIKHIREILRGYFWSRGLVEGRAATAAVLRLMSIRSLVQMKNSRLRWCWRRPCRHGCGTRHGGTHDGCGLDKCPVMMREKGEWRRARVRIN